MLGSGVYQHHLTGFPCQQLTVISWFPEGVGPGWKTLDRQLWEYWSGIIKQIRRAPLLADKWSKNQEQSHLHREYMIGMPPTFW